jgi:hypothetical protein
MATEERLEELAYSLGRRFAEERERLREQVAAMIADVETHKATALLDIERATARIESPEPLPITDPVPAILDSLRGERLDLDEKLFAATKRFDRLSAALEERLAELKDGEPGPPGADGEPGPEGPPGRDGADGVTGEPRGKYDPAETYGKFDRVSFNGSEWIARQDDPGPLPGDGWMLGAQGKRGRPGVGIQSLSVKNYAVVMELDNGKTVTCDLRGMFERYHEERGE